MERELGPGAITDLSHAPEEAQSAVSWSAVLAGAVAALALSFVLLALAAGFGLQMASPWPAARATPEGFTPVAGSILIAVQVVCAGLGGYLAGRLRTKWTHVHGHEVHFRDTAHGLLVWAVSTLAGLVIAALLVAPAAGQAGAIAAAAAASPDPSVLQLQAERARNLASQMSLFMGIGLLLSAFIASVAAAIGGLRRDDMHVHYWTERRSSGRATSAPH